jgi:hypothetical protein
MYNTVNLNHIFFQSILTAPISASTVEALVVRETCPFWQGDVSPSRRVQGLEALSPMMTHAARGRPSFSTSVTMPTYV